MDELIKYLIAAISTLALVITALCKVITVLFRKNEAKGDLLMAFAERMLKGEFCENCKKSI